ncbi:MAG: carboxylesterase family protein [Erysipelotrichaceae bacterium]|nr:carboxylesterase family protein [Erysipelotrichaceae bacterium]
MKAPEEPEKGKGIRLCDEYGLACMQFDRWGEATDDINDDSGHPYIKIRNYPYPPKMSEDCLYLNIYTPASTHEDNLPVMMYIHGGGCQQWYGNDYEYCGDNFCRQGCVLVSINYRLNIFGYFVHPQLAKESGHDASGNYGTMDQIQALKWVYENIRAFGGDPKNITVFGQSAGGRSSMALWCSPLSEDLVNRVSIQSAGGLGTIMSELGREHYEKMGEQFMKDLGCSNIEEMRKLPAEVLRDQNDKLGFFNGFNMYTDGYVLDMDIEEKINRGLVKDVDVICGCTVDEGANEKKPMFGSNTYAQVLALARKQNQNKKKPVHVYVFDRPQPGDDAGVPHSCDNRYQFGSLDGSWRPYDDSDWALSEKMQKYWANFARTGDPNGEGLEKWNACKDGKRTLRLAVEGCEMKDYYSEDPNGLKKEVTRILRKNKRVE